MKRRILMCVLVLVVANALFYLGMVERTDQDIRNMEIERLTILNLCQEINGLRERAEVLQVDLAEVRRELVNFNALLVDERELVDLVAEITRIANVSGVDIKAVEYEPQLEGRESDLRHIFVSFPVRGEYLKIRSFVLDLEKVKKLVRIKDMTSIQVKPGRMRAGFGKSVSGGSGGELELRLRLVVFFQTDLAGAAEDVPGAPTGGTGAFNIVAITSYRESLESLQLGGVKRIDFLRTGEAGKASGDVETGGEVRNIFDPLFVEKIAAQKVEIKQVVKEPEPPPLAPVKQAVVSAEPAPVVQEEPDLGEQQARQWLDGFEFIGLIHRKTGKVEYFLSDGKDFHVVRDGGHLRGGEVSVKISDGYLLLKHSQYELEREIYIPDTGISE